MPTQQEIADHLDLAQQQVSELMQKLGIDWRSSSLDAIRVAYIRQIRGQAAGHRSAAGDDLVAERVKSERVNRELMLLQLHEKRGTLIHVEQLRPMLSQMFTAFRTELLARDDKLKVELDALYGIDVDFELLNGHTRSALEQLARYEPGDPSADPLAGVDAAAAGADDDDGVGDSLPSDVSEDDGAAGAV